MIQPRNITLICGAGGKTVDIYAVVRGEIGAGLRRAGSRQSIHRDRSCRLIIYELIPPPPKMILMEEGGVSQ